MPHSMATVLASLLSLYEKWPGYEGQWKWPSARSSMRNLVRVRARARARVGVRGRARETF